MVSFVHLSSIRSSSSSTEGAPSTPTASVSVLLYLPFDVVTRSASKRTIDPSCRGENYRLRCMLSNV
jgi:hypothetical protein